MKEAVQGTKFTHTSPGGKAVVSKKEDFTWSIVEIDSGMDSSSASGRKRSTGNQSRIEKAKQGDKGS